MNRSASLTLVYIVSTYLALGGIFFLVAFFRKFGFFGYLEYLIPATICMLILMFFVVAGIAGILRPVSIISRYLLTTALLMQSIQIVLFGIVFKNFYGPYLAIGFTDTPVVNFILEFKIFVYLTLNGWEKGSDEITLIFNLLPLATMMIINTWHPSKLANKEPMFVE